MIFIVAVSLFFLQPNHHKHSLRWYVAGNKSVKGLVACTSSFDPKNNSDGTGEYALFPEGLAPLPSQFGGGLMLYMVNFCPSVFGGNPYLSDSEAAMSFPDPVGHYFASPRAEASELAYGRLMDHGIAQGMTLFEIDFMEKNFQEVPYYRTTAGAADAWLSGLSRAATARGLATQLCSAAPRDALASVALASVTQFRASMDFACGCAGEPKSGNWDIGGTALLLSALGLGVSKDVFFTANQTGINHGQVRVDVRSEWCRSE